MAEAVLRGRVTLDDSAFAAGLRRAETNAARFSKTITTKFGAGLQSAVGRVGSGLAAGIGIAAFTRSINASLELGGQLNDLSASTGIAVGELYKLKGVFENNDQGAQDVAKSISRMQKSLVAGGEAFDKLGLSAQSLLTLSPSEQFQQIGTAIDRIENPAQKAALAMEIFGKSGAELIPVFQDLKNLDLSKLSATAELLQRNAEHMDRMGDAMKDMKREGQGFSIGVSAGILEGLEKVTKEASGRDFSDLGERFGKLLSEGVQKGAAFGDRIKSLFPFGSYIHDTLGKSESPKQLAISSGIPELPESVTSGSGFKRLESFKSFTDPYGKLDASGATKLGEKRTNDFIKFFNPGMEEGGRLKALGAYSALGSNGIEGMSRAYPTSPNAYKTNPAAYGQSGTAAEKGKDSSAEILSILQSWDK